MNKKAVGGMTFGRIIWIIILLALLIFMLVWSLDLKEIMSNAAGLLFE
jgi:uncharacterized membrane protein